MAGKPMIIDHCLDAASGDPYLALWLALRLVQRGQWPSALLDSSGDRVRRPVPTKLRSKLGGGD
jgi:hypothetical protein